MQPEEVLTEVYFLKIQPFYGEIQIKACSLLGCRTVHIIAQAVQVTLGAGAFLPTPMKLTCRSEGGANFLSLLAIHKSSAVKQGRC